MEPVNRLSTISAVEQVLTPDGWRQWAMRSICLSLRLKLMRPPIWVRPCNLKSSPNARGISSL
ncbi:hypothetical protein [Paenibacillus monticola]|uniref:Uncharacterized protein n=1 Tax=Paenibacillus monticola TaxID=2666075 RepID=A0A7X2L0B4_9BACL|nr:hypothetical protein [Paenibacillus monticola]MRN51910.1 hypothetical protein [Paenibacillus monticola]